MSEQKKGGHYEMVLEDRHLLGVFFAVVLLCAIFFTLGFVLGRNQTASQQAAVPPARKTVPDTQPPAPVVDDLSFYKRVEGKSPAETLPARSSPPPKPQESKPTETPPSQQVAPPAAALTTASPPATASIYLQVAAVTQESDAKRLAGELRKLGFPSFVVPPRDDRLYRVQVGPFESAELADAAKGRLEAQGFRNILKR
ncbi:MAG: SPOR domain-containing protein [Acidobacteria bacterium]|nr:SPOR domain-containing protein [Acidobacteriota bacterium]